MVAVCFAAEASQLSKPSTQSTHKLLATNQTLQGAPRAPKANVTSSEVFPNPKQCTKITGEDLTCPEGQDLSCCNRKECGTFIQFVEQYVIENPEIHELGSALVLLPFSKPACEKAGKGHYLACSAANQQSMML